MSEAVLELHDIVVEYDRRTVLDVPYLAVHRGEVLTLLGENGSGKTTLLRLLGLLVRPRSGKVVFANEVVDFDNRRRLLELRRRMSTVMQEPLLCRMSVRRNVALGLRFRGLAVLMALRLPLTPVGGLVTLLRALLLVGGRLRGLRAIPMPRGLDRHAAGGAHARWPVLRGLRHFDASRAGGRRAGAAGAAAVARSTLPRSLIA